MQRSTLPRDMYHGKGTLKALKILEDRKVIVCVGGGFIRRGGSLDRTVTYLRGTGMEVRLFEGIESDPSVETIVRGAGEMLVSELDQIVAMGGRSPIDVAKAMRIKYEYPEVTSEDICKVFGIPKLCRKVQFRAVSSASGVAVEVATFSIIIDYQRGIKYPITDFGTAPDIAIVDPDLVTTVPIKLVTHMGVGVMTRATEAYASTANSNFTDPLATHAIEMIKGHLVESYSGDMGFHAAMHDTQCLVGQTLSSALLGAVHSMAHKTGAVFADQGVHIIHGTADAMYLPKVIKFNAKNGATRKRYGVIVDYIHLGGFSDEEEADLLIAYLREMSNTLYILYYITHYGKNELPAEGDFVSEDVFLVRVEDITTDVILDAYTGSSPRQPSQEEAIELLKCCYYDTKADFQYRS